MQWGALLACVMTAAAALANAGDLTVPLPEGETSLGDIGTYRVAYQSYGGPEVAMPISWLGHFEEESGISYVVWPDVIGRRAILLHSPWRVPPGKVWVDYRLRLPQARPVKLAFGIAMGPDVAVPGKSDGATFCCSVLDGDRERELLRRHYDRGEWLDFEFDLSEFAGREIILRLQTDPGPDRNPAWDYSYFGAPRIIAGTAGESRAAIVDRMTATRACRAAQGAGTLPLSNDPSRRVAPSNLLPCRNSIRSVGQDYEFVYEGDDCRVVYGYRPSTGTLDDFEASVDGGRPFRPVMGGGVVLAVGEGDSARQVPARGGRPLKLELAQDGRALRALWEYDADGTAVQVAWEFGISGKALLVSATAERPSVCGFSLGDVAFTPLRRSVDVPYLEGHVDYLPVEDVFVCRYLDWTRSHSSRCPQGVAVYEPKTDGTRNALSETGYVAVSPNVGEVLPNIPRPPSPYLQRLAPLVMLDVWGHDGGTFQGDADNLRLLKDNGVDHLAVISHIWQRYGYDVKLPDHIPANPEFGGDEGMAEFGRAANECGYLWSLHENYVDLYPDAPSFDPTAVVLLADGSRSPAWFNGRTGVQSFGLKCSRALEFARRNSPEIHSRYGTTAAYLDVHTCVPPWHQLDHDAAQPMAAMALAKVKHDAELFQYMRDTHEGPLFGEGAGHFYWAGLCDGVEAQVAGGERNVPFLDFDLLKIHPQMVNHGMGYYERWFERGYGLRWGVDAGTAEQIDKYRAQEIAYGHAGFVGGAQTTNVQWVAKEHHMVHPVQRLYGAARPTEILYEVDGRLVSVSAALAVGELRRQRVTYDSGLTVWVNWHPEPWHVREHVLPQWGFLALGPDTCVWTALANGKYADYAECPEYVFADARTSFNIPYLARQKDIEPRLARFRHLGGNRIELTYEWRVNDTLEEDCHCFVHFVNEQSGRPEHIEFQQDHVLPAPTSAWRKGDVITDGPYEVHVPEDGFDSYDVLIGLYRDGRVALKGAQTPDDRILIGRLAVERENGRIAGIALADAGGEEQRDAAERADFTAHLNPPGTRIDFSAIATDGSVKVAKGEGALTIFPYPRDRAFSVELDLAVLAPHADPARVRVRALRALTQDDMGGVDFAWRNGRLAVTLGRKGAGRYLVTWQEKP